MEKIEAIKNEIKEKKGREWLGLQLKTEKQLESLMYYLDHPKIYEYPRLLEELMEFYYIARSKNFTKMEDIIRKLDQLSIKLGKYDERESASAQKRPELVNYAYEIVELKKRLDNLMASSLGMSLPELTQNSLATFLSYLSHPVLQKKKNLFDDMLAKYNQAEALDFSKMQAFNDMLNMAEIKLGKITGETVKWKSVEEIQKDLKEEKENLEAEKEKLKAEYSKLEAEKEELKLGEVNLKMAIEELEAERKKLEDEKKSLETEKEKFAHENETLKIAKEELEPERKRLEEEKNNLEAGKKKLEVERDTMKTTIDGLELETKKLEVEKEKLKVEKEKLEVEWKKLELARE